MSRRIVYLVNPLSGTQAKSSVKEMIAARTKARGIPFEIVATRADGDYEKLVEECRSGGVTDVVVCGGDGTVNKVVNAFQRTVNIGIIPMGSGNGLALAGKIPPQPTRALELVFSGKPRPTDAFRINGHFSCMLCGIGFDAGVAHDFAREKRRGLQTYIRVTTRNFFRAKPWPFEIRCNDREIRTEAFFISLANSNQFGNNFTIAPKASLHDGLLDVVIVKKMPKLLLPISVISQVAGANAPLPGKAYNDRRNILYLQTDSVTIRNPGLAPLHIDGDPGESETVFRAKVLKNHFNLILPDNRP